MQTSFYPIQSSKAIHLKIEEILVREKVPEVDEKEDLLYN